MNPIEFLLQGHSLRDTEKLEALFKSTLDISLLQLAIPSLPKNGAEILSIKKSDQESELLYETVEAYEKLESGSNLRVLENIETGEVMSVDWTGRREKGRKKQAVTIPDLFTHYSRHSRFRPATKDELSHYKEDVNKKFKELGIIEIRKGEKGAPGDVILEDIKRFSPHAGAFTQDGRVFMPRGTLDPKSKMQQDMYLSHEKGHQKRHLSGEKLSVKEKHWHDRPEEQQAIRDALDALKKNFAEADIPFNKTDAYRWLTESSRLEAMENPSKTPFLDRMEYLPTGPEYNASLTGTDWKTGEPVQTTYDNPAAHMDAIMKIETDAFSAGLDIKYPKMGSINLRGAKEYTERHKTIWDIVNE